MKATLRSIAFGAAALLAAPGVAQTTPEAYLAELQALYGALGLSFEFATQERVGDALVLTGVTYGIDTPEMTAKVEDARYEIRPATEAGHELETVSSDVITVTLTPKMSDAPLAPEANPAPGTTPAPTDPATIPALPGPMAFRIEIPKNRTLIGGTPAQRTFSFGAESMRLVLDGFAPDPSTGDTMTMVVAMAAPAFSGDMQPGAGGKVTYRGTSPSMTADVSIVAPDGNAAFSFGYTEVSLEGEGVLSPVTNPAVLMASEAISSVRLAAASSTGTMKFDEAGAVTEIALRTGPSRFAGTFGQGVLDYDLDYRDVAVSSPGGPQNPPFQFGAGTFAVRFAMPVAPREAASEAKIGLRFENVTLSEDVWAMFDPAQAVPRTPATVILKVTSTARALVNLMDPEAMEASMPESGMPFQFDDLKISELTVRFGGAEVLASGSAVINNAGPVPMPVGSLDVTINGLVGLLQTLQQVGLVTPDQVMPATGMLMTFARPGTAPDSFTSKIEMKEDGSIFANGVQVQ